MHNFREMNKLFHLQYEVIKKGREITLEQFSCMDDFGMLGKTNKADKNT